MLNEVRELVEGLYINSPKKIQEALKVLLEAPPSEGEDYVIISIKEAIDGGHLPPCSKTAAIVSGIIADSAPKRDILMSVADGINDSIVCQDPDWLEDIIFGDTDIPKDSRQAFWSRIDKVQEVKQLFAQAPYSSAIDERCKPIPATPGATPTIDDLCDDDDGSASTADQYRPDPIPSDWKKDDTCAGIDKAGAESGSDASTGGAPPDANTDVWPEGDVDYERYHIDDMGYVNYI